MTVLDGESMLQKLFFVPFLLVASCISALAVSPDLVISQVYGGGGNAGATFKNDFIEIFNRGSLPASLAGMSVQYGSTTGNMGSGGLLTLLPPITLQPGQYFLVRESAGAGGTADLPAPDATGNIAMSATGGKVALVNSTAPLGCATVAACAGLPIIDGVGYDGALFFETPATPTLANATAAIRKGGGCIDTNNNSADFVVGAPTPRNSASAAAACNGSTAPSAV